MIHQRLIIPFGHQPHLGDARIDHIGQGEVDEPIPAAKGNRAQRPQRGEIPQGFVVHVGKQDAHGVVVAHINRSPFHRIRSWLWPE